MQFYDATKKPFAQGDIAMEIKHFLNMSPVIDIDALKIQEQIHNKWG